MAKAKAKSKKRATAATRTARKNVAALVNAAEGKARRGRKAKEVAPPAATDADAGKRRRWKELSLDELQALYNETLGRPTGSDDRAYLIWKIREAEKGNVPVGPARQRKLFEGPTTPITVKFEDAFLDALDSAAESDGFKTRLAYIRDLMSKGLELRGHSELAVRVVGS